MTVDKTLMPTIIGGWQDFQKALAKAIAPFDAV